MILNTVRKQEIVGKFKRHEKDSGSCEVQIAIITERIKNLTEHLKTHKKDFSSRRGLLILVGQRSALLAYLKKSAFERYKALIAELGIRK